MLVQGSGLNTSIKSESISGSHKNEKRKATEQTCAAKKSDSVEISNSDLDRSELIRKIRNKIENGFYNSDSVLEDISHGFAKAFDTL